MPGSRTNCGIWRRAWIGIPMMVTACATGSSASTADAYLNPPECSAVVQARSADPALAVDAPPVPRGVWKMPDVSSSPPVTVTVHMTVSELGEVVASSIQVEGGRTSAEHAAVREAAEKWTFRPARHDGCWVPGMFETRIELGESPERERDERG